MSVILLTGTGLGIGGFISWLVDRYPHLFVSADSLKRDWISSRSFVTILFIVGLALNFYGLSTGYFSTSQITGYGFLLSVIWTAAFFDIRYRLIPNRLLFAGIAGWGCIAFLGYISILPAVFAAICAAASVLMIRLAGFLFYQKAGMGVGDIKLVFFIGLFLQWEVFWVLYLAVLAGGIWGIAGLVSQKIDRESKLPFAPFLWIAASIAVFIPYNEFMSIWL